jgi:Ni/Fe-hydrogenase subunit HybB-like protein
LLINKKLPFERKLLLSVIKNQLCFFMLLPSMGLIFSCTGVAMIYFTHEALPHFIGSTFLLAGLAILIFAFISNYSSIKYYYEKGLLKQHGREVQAETINKRTENFNSKAFRSTSDSSIIIER